MAFPDVFLLPRQDNSTSNCPPCGDPAPCACSADERCVLVNRDCFTCSYNKCVPITSSSTKKSGGVSSGAVAGAVIAVVAFLAIVLLGYFWYRRRQRRLAPTNVEDAKVEEPARAEDVLNRPDPNEKPVVSAPPPVPTTPASSNIRVYGNSNTTINLDPEADTSMAGTQGHPARASVQSNPFSDGQSIQTFSTGTQSNVIPIALVPPGSVSSASQRSDPTLPSTQATAGSVPSRPARDPSLNLDMNSNGAANAASRSVTPISNSSASGFTNIRNSYMSTGSYASDFLNEAPVIITPTRGTVKQVVGVVKAEVIRTPAGSSTSDPLSASTSTGGLHPGYGSNRPPARSPLAASSFGPADMLRETEEEHSQEVEVRSDPFGDEYSPYAISNILSDGTQRTSPAPSTSTFGSPLPVTTPSQTTQSDDNWSPGGPQRPWTNGGKGSRESISTQAGSVIGADIVGVTRVHVGLDQLNANHNLAPPTASEYMDTPVSASLSSPRSPYRMTSAKIVSPATTRPDLPSPPAGGALESQQKRALEELDASRRVSRSSVVSSTSTRADSILEGFPFVPPSPISNRPLRTPPRSPLAQQTFMNNNRSTPSSPLLVPPTPQQGVTTPLTPPPSPPAQSRTQMAAKEEEQGQVVTVPSTRTRPPPKKANLPPPPSINRKVMNRMSVSSEISTMSNGLGAFPFQIDNGPESSTGSESSAPPSSLHGKQRASLDTLALTSDLSSYPLGGFDKNLMDHYPPKRS
ncbi:hypothetical protein C8Q75DRAFT_809739 [Abortiporus biennis]|nr:hypothetical protein C8Q75DRAFT_809739 [Abortiporus biennis]